MSDTAKDRPWFTAARYVVFLALLCLYVRYRIEPYLHFEAHPEFPIFYSNAAFWREFLSYPGGPLRYVAGFLSLSYHSPWGGAIVITIVVGLLCWSADVLILALGGARVRGLAFLPAIILIVALNLLLSQLTMLLTLLAASLSLVFYLGLSGGGDGRRIVTFLGTSAVLYYVAAGAFPFFALLVTLYELLIKRARLPALVSLLSIEAIPYLAAASVFSVSLVDAYARGLPWHPDTKAGPLYLIAACYACFPLLVLGFGLQRTLAERRGAAGKARSGRPRRVHPLAGPLVLLALGVAVAVFTLDANAHRVLVVDYCARQGDWAGVLQAARGLPMANYTDVVSQHVNQALYETGRLGDEMFSYPQVADWLLVDVNLGRTPEEQGVKMQGRADLWFQIGDLDLRLGLANEAEHEGHEALAVFGPHPEILKRLAMVNLVKRQPAAARVFLNALTFNPVYRGEAESTLQRMAADPSLPGDPQVRRFRSVALARDRQFRWNSLEARCQGLLEDHPNNRMAYEYLMAWHLLHHDLTAFTGELPRLRGLGYPKLPRHYQEAILLHEAMTTRPSDRAGYPMSSEVLQSFAEFSQAMRETNQDARAVARRFGDTYFYYYAFGVTGAMVEP
jgi:hypothetical protein